MGQERPSQPHPNHQEEAEKDEAGLHSCRGSERRDTEDGGLREAPSLWTLQSCQMADALGMVDGSPGPGLGKGHGFCKGEMLERSKRAWGRGLARERFCTSQGCEKALEGVTG